MALLSRLFDTSDQEQRLSFANTEIPRPSENDAYFYGAGSGGAMSLSAFYACVTLLADSIATLGIRAYRQNGQARELVSPQPRLLADEGPYPETTWFEWLWMTMEATAVTGNGIGVITARNKEDKATAVMPVHPDVLNIDMPKKSKWPEPIYKVDGTKIPAEDIMHIKRYPVAGAVRSMSPVEKAASSVGLGLAAERFGLRYFQDSASPSSVLESTESLDDEQVKRTMKSWIASNGGRRRPAVLSGGLKWKPIALTPNESQFLETRQFQRSEICMWFRVPPHMIGDTQKSTSWGTGIENMTIGFVKYTLNAWLTCIEQALTRLLPRGQFAMFNIDGLLRGDVKSRWEAYRIGRDSGVYSANDIRAMEYLPPIGPEGDIHLQPANFVPLGTDPADLQNTPADDPAGKPDDEPQANPSDDPAADDSDEDEEDDDQ